MWGEPVTLDAVVISSSHAVKFAPTLSRLISTPHLSSPQSGLAAVSTPHPHPHPSRRRGHPRRPPRDTTTDPARGGAQARLVSMRHERSGPDQVSPLLPASTSPIRWALSPRRLDRSMTCSLESWASSPAPTPPTELPVESSRIGHVAASIEPDILRPARVRFTARKKIPEVTDNRFIYRFLLGQFFLRKFVVPEGRDLSNLP